MDSGVQIDNCGSKSTKPDFNLTFSNEDLVVTEEWQKNEFNATGPSSTKTENKNLTANYHPKSSKEDFFLFRAWKNAEHCSFVLY